MRTSKLKYSIFQLIPMVLDSLKLLSKDVLDKDIMYSLLLVLSGILTDKNGKTVYVNIIIFNFKGVYHISNPFFGKGNN